MTTNFTTIVEGESIFDVFSFINSASDGIFIQILILAIFFVLLLKLNTDLENRLMVGSFVGLILSVILVYNELLPIVYVIIFIVILSLSALYSLTTR